MENQDYSTYKATDFLLDDFFVRWVKTGDPVLNEFWVRWVNDHPEQKEEISRAIQILESLNFEEPEVEQSVVDVEWAKLRKAFTQSDIIPPHEEETESLETPKRFPWLAAASIFLLLLAGGIYYFNYHSVEEKGWVVRTAAPGQRLTIVLKDGSKVLLNSGSTLAYPEHFQGDRRSVTLIGEAFFDVAPNPQVPFIITTGKVITEVVGTSFGITAYPEQGDVQVAVVTGSVNVYAHEAAKQNAKLSLIPDQMATFAHNNDVFFVSEFDKSKKLAWIEGVLYFERDDFKSVVQKIEKWYGVKVIVDPQLKPDDGLLLTGKFKNKPLSYVLDSYKYPNRFNYEIHKDTLRIFE